MSRLQDVGGISQEEIDPLVHELARYFDWDFNGQI
jgi:hypothetical protein